MSVGGNDVGVGTVVSVRTAVAAGVGVSRKRTAVGCKIAVATSPVGPVIVPSCITAVGIINSDVSSGASPPQAVRHNKIILKIRK
jgi:hypothetical protein